jgi:type VI protein secretion system component VasK
MKRHRLLYVIVVCFLLGVTGLAVNIIVFHQHDTTTSRLALYSMIAGAILLATTWLARVNERHQQEEDGK